MAARRLPRSLVLACALAAAGCQGGGGGNPNAQDEETSVAGTDAQIVDSLVLTAQASEASGDWEGASQYWGSLMQRDPTNERYALGLGKALRHTGRYGDAVQVLREGLVHHPDSAPLLGSLGKALLASGQREEAIITLTQAAALAPNDWQIQSALAVAYGMTAKPDLAEQHYRQAMALAPDNPVVLNNYALHLAINGRLAQGLDLMEKAAASAGATSQVRENLALLLAVSGDMGRAEEIVRGDLTRDAADRQMAFLRTLSSDDIVDLGGIVDQSALVIDSSELPPPGGSIADLTNLGAQDSTFLEDQPDVVVIDEEPLMLPPVEAESASEEPVIEAPAAMVEDETEQAPAAVISAPEPEPLAEPEVEAEAVEAVALAAPEPEPAAEEASEPGSPPVETPAQQSAALSASLADALAGQDAAAAAQVPAAIEPPAPPPEESLAVAAPAAEPVAEETIVAEPVVAAPVAEEPVAAAAPAVTGPAWRVQLASLATREAAERGRNQAIARHPGLLDGDSVEIVSAVLDNGNTTWRVLAGRYGDKAGAVALCEAVRAEGGDCFVMKDGG